MSTKRKPATKPVARKRTAAAARVVAAPVIVQRVSKGRRPQYFSDPAIDKILWATLTLAQELAVTRDRLDTVERLLAGKNVLRSGAVDAYQPPAAVATTRDRDREAFIARILRAVEAELEEATGRDSPRSQDDVIAAVSE